MSLEKTIQELRDLLSRCTHDLQKTERGNKAAAQRVRTGTVRLEKVAKRFRKESVAEERSGSFKKYKEKSKKASSQSNKSGKKKAAGKKTAAKAAPKKAAKKASAPKKKASKAPAKKKIALKRPANKSRQARFGW